MDNEEYLSSEEKSILSILDRQVDLITHGKIPLYSSVASIINLCSSFYYPDIFCNYSATEVVSHIENLLNKGFVKKYYDENNYPSFVPTYKTIIEDQTSTQRYFTQNDTNYIFQFIE